jgi:hypothetical protein
VSNLSSTSFSRLHFTFTSFSSLNCPTFGAACYFFTSFSLLFLKIYTLTSLSNYCTLLFLRQLLSPYSSQFLNHLVTQLCCIASQGSQTALLCKFTSHSCCFSVFPSELSPYSAVFLQKLVSLYLCCTEFLHQLVTLLFSVPSPTSQYMITIPSTAFPSTYLFYFSSLSPNSALFLYQLIIILSQFHHQLSPLLCCITSLVCHPTLLFSCIVCQPSLLYSIVSFISL